VPVLGGLPGVHVAGAVLGGAEHHRQGDHLGSFLRGAGQFGQQQVPVPGTGAVAGEAEQLAGGLVAGGGHLR
jgi:hypothetical protein